MKSQVRPYVYVSPAKRAAQYRAIEAAYARAVSRYIAKLLKGAA